MTLDWYEVDAERVKRDAHQTAGFLRYLEWLAKEGHKASTLQVWEFYEAHIRDGVLPTEAADKVGLPHFPEW